MGSGSSDEDMRARLEAVLEPGEELLWTDGRKVRFGQSNRRLALMVLFGALVLTICWLVLAFAIAFVWCETYEVVAFFQLVLGAALMSFCWCIYFSIDRNSRLAHRLAVFCALVLTVCRLLSAVNSIGVLLWTADADSVELWGAASNVISVSTLLSVIWWSILSDSLDGAPRRFLFLTDRRFGFLSPFPLFHANDRVVTTPLEGIADLSVLKRADGVGDLTFVGEWSRPEPRFSGPCTFYDVENVEGLARKLAEAAGVEPTIRKA